MYNNATQAASHCLACAVAQRPVKSKRGEAANKTRAKARGEMVRNMTRETNKQTKKNEVAKKREGAVVVFGQTLCL